MVCALAIALQLIWHFRLFPDGVCTNFCRTVRGEHFWTVMAVVFCAYIFAVSFCHVITYWGHTFGVRIETDFQRDLFQHIQELVMRILIMLDRTADEPAHIGTFDITEFAHHAEDIFISTVTIIGAQMLCLRFSDETGTGNRNYHSDFFLLIIMEMPFSMQNASLYKKRWQRLIPILNPDFPDFELQKLLPNEDKELDKFDSANLSYRDSQSGFYRAIQDGSNAVINFYVLFFLRL